MKRTAYRIERRAEGTEWDVFAWSVERDMWVWCSTHATRSEARGAAANYIETFAAWQWWQDGTWQQIYSNGFSECASCLDPDVRHFLAATNDPGYECPSVALCENCEQARRRRVEGGSK